MLDAINENVSDVHFESDDKFFKVRFRTHGTLYEKAYINPNLRSEINSIIKVLAELDITNKRKPQDGNFYFDNNDGTKIEFRVATAPTAFGENIVLRLFIGRANNELDELGFEKSDYSKIVRMIKKSHGIIFVVGPTGSGKTTTLYSFLNRLNHPDKKIITVEDPIERHIPGVQQTQVKINRSTSENDFTFSDGIKSCLRQDADVIMLGEIREGETANVTLQAALTGHLILTTIHAIQSEDVISRLKSMGVETYLLASAFNGVIAQRLVKKLCPDCKQKIDAPAAMLQKFSLDAEIEKELRGVGTYYTYGPGCETCKNTSIVGRIGVFEVLMATEKVKELIFDDASTLEIRKQAIREGMQEFKTQYIRKAKRGEIALEEVIQAMFDFG